MPRRAKPSFSKPRFSREFLHPFALRSTDSLWLENCMISQSFEPSRGRAAKVLVQKLLRAVEPEKQGLKNRVWPALVMPLFLMGCLPADLREAKRPLRPKSGKRPTPLRSENGPLRRGNGPLRPWCWLAFQSASSWAVFGHPLCGGKRPLEKGPLRGLWLMSPQCHASQN